MTGNGGTPGGAGRAGGRTGALGAVLLAWVLSVAFDLFLHAAVLADAYQAAHPALLEPMEAFRRIPIGYATFLLLTIALWWLLVRLDVRGWLDGARFGLASGLVVWGALVLGLYSITTLEPGLLTGWWVGQGVELGLAGAVLGAARSGARLRRLAWKVALAVVVLVVTTFTIQSLTTHAG